MKINFSENNSKCGLNETLLINDMFITKNENQDAKSA